MTVAVTLTISTVVTIAVALAAVATISIPVALALSIYIARGAYVCARGTGCLTGSRSVIMGAPGHNSTQGLKRVMLIKQCFSKLSPVGYRGSIGHREGAEITALLCLDDCSTLGGITAHRKGEPACLGNYAITNA